MSHKHYPTEKFYLDLMTKQTVADSAHDIAHIERVVANAKRYAQQEQADLNIILPAAWLHDIISVPKDSPLRSQASRLAAEEARKILQSIPNAPFSEDQINRIAHAIEAHSFSANIKPQTLEAKIVQDADRMDSLGAIGISRCLLVGGALGRSLYYSEDPFCQDRTPDDQKATIDHFYTKLFRIAETLQTNSAKQDAKNRVSFMKQYLNQLKEEIS